MCLCMICMDGYEIIHRNTIRNYWIAKVFQYVCVYVCDMRVFTMRSVWSRRKKRLRFERQKKKKNKNVQMKELRLECGGSRQTESRRVASDRQQRHKFTYKCDIAAVAEISCCKTMSYSHASRCATIKLLYKKELFLFSFSLFGVHIFVICICCVVMVWHLRLSSILCFQKKRRIIRNEKERLVLSE